MTPATNGLGAITVALYPNPGSSTLNAQPTVEIDVLDRETTSVRSSFVMTVDGVPVPRRPIVRARRSHLVPKPDSLWRCYGHLRADGNALAAGVHQALVTYQDTAGASYTNTWSFTTVFISSVDAGLIGQCSRGSRQGSGLSTKSLACDADSVRRRRQRRRRPILSGRKTKGKPLN